jgi:hypothetical protein
MIPAGGRIVALAAVLLGGCAATRPSVRADAQLVVTTNVPDARIYVDDAFRGRAAELRGQALLVPSGTRRVELRADGWFTAYRDVAVPHAGRATVAVSLRPVPANEPGE